MAGQIQLFEAISCLPECTSFPNWPSLQLFYSTQKQHVQGVPTNSGNAIFNFKFSASVDLSGTATATVAQVTNVMLPAALQKQFPVSVETPLALLPCPHCLKEVKVSMEYVSKVDNPLDQFLEAPEPVEAERKLVEGGGRVKSEEMSNAPILAEIERQMMV